MVVVFRKSRTRRKAGNKRKKKLSFLLSLLPLLSKTTTLPLAQAPRLALRLQQRQDVALADGALDVAHDEAVLVVKELDADLGDLVFFGIGFLWFRGFMETRGAEEVSETKKSER